MRPQSPSILPSFAMSFLANQKAFPFRERLKTRSALLDNLGLKRF